MLFSASRPSSIAQCRNALRSSDLGGGLAKNGCFSTRATASSSTLPAAAVRPSSSRGCPVRRRTKSSISALPGPVSKAMSSTLPSMKVTLATPPRLSTPTGCARLSCAHQGAMEHRHDRGALPAGGDVGGAEVIDHGDAEPGGERRPIAELDREAAVGPVQDGLAVEADHSDRARRHPVRGQERFHRLGMHVGDEFFDLGENFRPLGAVAEIGRDRDRAPQQVPLLVAVGPVSGGAETNRSPRRRSRSARRRPRHRRCRSSDRWQ